jgi:hypothetical protein
MVLTWVTGRIAITATGLIIITETGPVTGTGQGISVGEVGIPGVVAIEVVSIGVVAAGGAGSFDAHHERLAPDYVGSPILIVAGPYMAFWREGMAFVTL